jgi:tetratricopeptide (TPR) repeat protein/predicted Ser/Thr protein kinase
MLGGLLAVFLALVTISAVAAAPPREREAELESRLATASETERVGILNQLAALTRRRDGRRAEAFATQALAQAERNGDQPGQALAHKNLALALAVQERSVEGIPHMERAHQLFVELGDRKSQANALGYWGMLLSDVGKLWQAHELTRRALALYTELGDSKGIAAATNNLGVQAAQLGEYEEALRYCLQSLGIEETLGRKVGIANNLNSIGNIYSELNDHLKAREYYQRALPLFQELEETPSLAKVINNIGNTYEKLDQDDEALRRFRQAFDLAVQVGSKSIEADARNNMGIVYKKRGRYPDALREYREVLRLKQEIGETTELAGTLHNLAEVHLLQGRYPQALEELRKARAIGQEAKSNEILDGVHRLTAQVYEAMGDWKHAYQNEVRYSEVREAMLDEQRNKKLAELQERYDAQARQRRIELLEKNDQIRRLALTRTRLLAGLLVAVTGLVLGLTLILFRRYLYLLAFWKKRSFVGGYRIEQEITSGGMGIVYRATSLTQPGRTVALKVIRDELSGDQTQRQRFINEGRIIDALDHPGIVKVLDRGEHAGRLYIAMEYLDGRTLAAMIAEATAAGQVLPVRRCLELLRRLFDAAAVIHAHGVIHRDITPANVIVVGSGDDQRPKLLDFGLAKADTMTTLTQKGEILGTLSYLAPERLQLGEPTPASDVFSLGAVAYELLTLQRPFRAEEPAELLRLVLDEPAVPPARLRPELGTELSCLILAMLSKDPGARPSDEELRHRITRAALEAA